MVDVMCEGWRVLPVPPPGLVEGPLTKLGHTGRGLKQPRGRARTP